MCGFAGVLDLSRSLDADRLRDIVSAMSAPLRHRGPDDDGVFIAREHGVALAHRRLSIIDLSAAGHQPMSSASGRMTLAYNGEMYNFPDLRREMEATGHVFRSHSDTEVMLELAESHGLRDALTRADGMFALALWDSSTRRLHLARDRFGEKPLYIGRAGRLVLFASELTAFLKVQTFDREIDRIALRSFLQYGYVPGPQSIYRYARKVPPGAQIVVDATTGAEVTEPFWSAETEMLTAAAHPFTGSETDAVDELDSVLAESVRRRMIADVPVGAFLSGGIDSSTVVALMQRHAAAGRVRTFTIGFREDAFDEARHARRVAAHLGTDHTELYVTAQEAQAVIPEVAAVWDEPFGDSSQIPTLLVARLARSDVKVALSGDGGDELFGGYERYHRTRRISTARRWIPRAVRGALAMSIRAVSAQRWDRVLQWGRRGGLPVPAIATGHRMTSLAELLVATSEANLYELIVSHWRDPGAALAGEADAAPSAWPWAPLPTLLERLMLVDTVSYLPDDILVKVDRAAMSASLEARVPLLSPDVAKFAWSIPTNWKTATPPKRLLRSVLTRYVPPALVDRPKMGFAIPLAEWLRGPLHPWASDLLSPDRLRADGFLNAETVSAYLAEHTSGARNWHFQLWNVLMFQAWLDAHGLR